MRFLHVADVHLGFSAYDVIHETGINAREFDVYFAWGEFIARAVQLRPDFVLIAGDLFDSAIPAPQAYMAAVAGLQRLECPVVIIMGNHEKPSAGNRSPIEALGACLPQRMVCVTEPKVVGVYNTPVFCAPSTGKAYELGKASILLAHGPVDGPEEYKYALAKLAPDTSMYGYCAMGDLHYRYSRGNLFYPGSLIPLTFNQEGKGCGFNEVTVTGDDVKVVSHDVPSRRLITIDTRDTEALSRIRVEDLEGAIVRVITDDADVTALREKLAPIALHVKIVRRAVDQEARVVCVEGSTLRDEYVDFSKKKGREDLVAPGLEYIGG